MLTLPFKPSATAPTPDATDPRDATERRLVEHSCEQAEITCSQISSGTSQWHGDIQNAVVSEEKKATASNAELHGSASADRL
jgi:hypothetical protein